MKSLIELSRDLKIDDQEISDLKNNIEETRSLSDSLIKQLERKERESALKSLYLCRIKDIYRLAKYQFSRLQEKPNQELTESDIQELDKWISRVKNEEGLIIIQQSLMELDKYVPSEIKTNLYALVQKIIIGGAYSKK